MPSFDALFASTKERPVYYKKLPLIRLDNIPFEDGDFFKVVFEKKNSEWRQGILLSIFGYFKIDGKQWQDRVLFWQDTAPKEIVLAVFTDKSKRKQAASLPLKGILGIKNIWDSGSGRVDSWTGGAAMIVEEIENGRRYCCNDGLPDENFDDIVFTVQKNCLSYAELINGEPCTQKNN